MTVFTGYRPRNWHTVARNLQLHLALEPEPGTSDLALTSPYDAAFLDALKQAVPGSGRRWDKDTKRWLIAPQYARVVVDLIKSTWGVELPMPDLPNSTITETRMAQLEYLGAAKARPGWDELTSYGYADGDWRLLFPVSVLTAWFMPGESRPGENRTLYGVLGVARAATPEDVKRAYRRAARTWHPDVCREPDAKEQFQHIQHAYSVLSDDGLRRKYNCGLALAERAAEAPRGAASAATWRPPLRCGLVMAEGRAQLGRFVVSRILAWEDITDSAGRTMVTTWKPGDDRFTVTWV